MLPHLTVSLGIKFIKKPADGEIIQLDDSWTTLKPADGEIIQLDDSWTTLKPAWFPVTCKLYIFISFCHFRARMMADQL